MMQSNHKIALLKACRIAGGQKQLAKKINVDPSRLNKWINRDKSIPARYAFAIENITLGQVTCYELLPEWAPFIAYHHSLPENKSDTLQSLTQHIYTVVIGKNYMALSSLEKNIVLNIIQCVMDEIYNYLFFSKK